MTIHSGSRVYVDTPVWPGNVHPPVRVYGLVTAETVVELATGARVFHVVWDDGDETDEHPANITEVLDA